jgi:tetratricopeptide (TPR) repeat protein
VRTAIAIILLFAARASASEWTRISAGRIEVLTDAGASTGKATLARLERIRAVLREAGPEEHALPLRVFVFASADEFRRYRPGDAGQGFFRGGTERDYIVLEAGVAAGRAVFHEYVHRALASVAAELPLWFQEGTAELFSNVELGKDTLRAGDPIPAHLSTLASAKWLTAEQLAAVGPRSPDYNTHALAGLFYAQSWALVHMLNLAPDYREALPRYLELLLSAQSPGHESNDAFRIAFGRGMDQAIVDLRKYLPRLRAASVSFVLPGDAAAPAVTRMAAVDALLARADLALQLERIDLARGLLEKAERDAPQSSAAIAGLGTLAMAEGRYEDARRQLERVIQSGPPDAGVLFEYAMLSRDTGAPRSRVDELLRRVVAVDPDFGEARFLLGSHLSDDGRWEDAVEHLQIAVRVLPRRSYVWHALGFAQWKLGRARDAGISAHRALATAQTSAEEQAAVALAAVVRENTK